MESREKLAPAQVQLADFERQTFRRGTFRRIISFREHKLEQRQAHGIPVTLLTRRRE